MKFEEIYSYENPLFANLKPSADEVSRTLLWSNRVGDTLKEVVRKKFKMPFTSEYFHRLAHKQLAYLDIFGDVLHTQNLEQAYPATPQLAEEIDDMNKAFYVYVETLNEVKKALYDFIKATDNADHKAMCIATEDILRNYSEDYTKLLEAYNTWQNASSITSFDSWVQKYESEDESA